MIMPAVILAIQEESDRTYMEWVFQHLKTMQVYKGDEPVTLSKKEFSLLLYLWENAGQIVSKESILEHVWDIDGQFVDDNTVTVNISRLKNKLGTEEIANVRGLGYIWTGKVNKN